MQTKWNLNEVYNNKEELLKEKQVLEQTIEELKTYQGKLNNKNDLESFLALSSKGEIILSRIYSYLQMKFDLNQKDLESQQDLGMLQNLLTNYVSAMSYVNEEILKNKYDDILAWSNESKVIKENLFPLKKIFDGAKHVLTYKEEKILANFSNVSGGYSSLYEMLDNSDNEPFEIETEQGEITVSKNNYTYYLATLKSQEDRRKVFETLYSFYDDHKNTFAAIYKGIIDKDIALMKSRNYKTILEAFLEHNQIPEQVYLSLIETAKKHTEPLKEWIQLRKKYFKLDEYHTYDRILTLAKSDVKYSYEKGYSIVMDALKDMGDDFIAHAKKALKDGHVDVYPTEGKRSGAYSTQIPEHGAYILLNHTDDLDSLFTLIHETGHSIHTLYALENQPYPTQDYVIFVAEIASTFNEQCLLDYLLKNSSDKNLKIQALEQQIDGIVGTFYRQTLFADFEYQAHMKALNGEGITYETLCNIMKDLYLEYYGIDLETEPLKKFVWAYIPHLFNSPFYVYQYATCLSASLQIYQNVKDGVEGAKEKYVNMLKEGGDDYPIEIIKRAGVDLTSEQPFVNVCNKLESLIKQLKELLD